MIKLLIALELHDAINAIKLDDIPFIAGMMAAVLAFAFIYVACLAGFDWLFERKLGIKNALWLTTLSSTAVSGAPFACAIYYFAP